MIIQKYFEDKIVYYKDGKPVYQFKLKKDKTELQELMEEEQSRTGNRDNFMKTQFEYNGTY